MSFTPRDLIIASAACFALFEGGCKKAAPVSTVRATREDSNNPQFPVAHGANGYTILSEIIDFREFCADSSTLQTLVRRNEVLVNYKGGIHAFAVTPGETVEGALRGLSNQIIDRDQMQPQLRLIRRSGIVQTTLAKDPASRQQFLSLPVSPGDLLYVTVANY